jgi:hypothetical protein
MTYQIQHLDNNYSGIWSLYSELKIQNKLTGFARSSRIPSWVRNLLNLLLQMKNTKQSHFPPKSVQSAKSVVSCLCAKQTQIMPFSIENQGLPKKQTQNKPNLKPQSVPFIPKGSAKFYALGAVVSIYAKQSQTGNSNHEKTKRTQTSRFLLSFRPPSRNPGRLCWTIKKTKQSQS